MVIGSMPAWRCSGQDRVQTASRPPSALARTPLASISPVPSSVAWFISASTCRAYGPISATASANFSSLPDRDVSPP